MTQKTIVVTGSTDGIGRQTALELLRLGHRVVVHGRSREKAERVAADLVKETKSTSIAAVHGDLSRVSEVRALAEAIGKEARLDVLVNNAGIFANERVINEDGHELTVAVNHVAPFLLTSLLLGKLRASGNARVINVASVAHNRGEVDTGDMTFSRGFSGYGAYASTKLMNVLFTYELARLLNADAKDSTNANVSVFALHPGVIGTKLLREGFGIGGASLSEGAKTSIMAATDPALEGKTGLYLSDGKIAQSSTRSRDPVLAKRLYEVTQSLVGVT